MQSHNLNFHVFDNWEACGVCNKKKKTVCAKKFDRKEFVRFLFSLKSCDSHIDDSDAYVVV